MSVTAVGETGTQRRPETGETASPAPGGAAAAVPAGTADRNLSRVRRAGWVVLGLQLVGLLIWSDFQYGRFATTMDFAIYNQAFSLVAHGHLDPFDTLNAMPFWQHDGELVMWLLAPLWWIWPHGPVLLWVQDVAMVGAEAVAFLCMCDLVGRARGTRDPARAGSVSPAVVAATGLVLLVVDPWTYWSVVWDFHVEPLGVLFAALVWRDVWTGRGPKRLWLWAGLALSCGSVVATYLVAVGIGAAGMAWTRRRAGRPDPGLWRRSLGIAALGLMWSGLLAVTHANRGADLITGYGYLAVGAGTVLPAQTGLLQIVGGVLGHPARIVSVLWHRRLDLYAILGPTGFLGIADLGTAPLVLLVLLENATNSYLGFAVPSFQDAPIYVLGAAGAVIVLAAVGRRRPRLAIGVAVAVAANAVAWGAVWLPRTASEWVRVSSNAAAVLHRAQQSIPGGAEVIASQGVAGRFGDRRWMYALFGPGRYPVRDRDVWVVDAPNEGIETLPVADSESLVSELAGPLRAHLVAHGGGVWVFRWQPAPGTDELVVPSHPHTIGGWTVPGTAGHPVLTGASGSWHVDGTGTQGYVVSGDYWREPRGHYRASITLSTAVPANVEVWDDTGDVLLGRVRVGPTAGTVTVTRTVDAERAHPDDLYDGAGPMRILPIPPPPGDVLEMRVWTAGGGRVRIGSLSLVPVGSR